MKKLLVIAACLGMMILGMAGVSHAVVYTNTDTLNQYLWDSGSISWTQPTPSDFQVPYDIVNSATLTIQAALAGTGDQVFVENIYQGNLVGGSGYTFSVFDIAEVFVKWNANDLLDITLKYVEGPYEFFQGLYLASSTFTLDYTNVDAPAGDQKDPVDNGTTPTPEPSTLLLLGSGLSGFAFWGKRRRTA